MEILRNLLGSVFSGIVRLAVTVGIIVAAYFFLLKPVLGTTEKAIEGANRTLEQPFAPSGELGDVSKTLESVSRRVQREVRSAMNGAERRGNPRKLVKCIQRANGDVHRIQRCARRH